jgi:hypothetical protein
MLDYKDRFNHILLQCEGGPSSAHLLMPLAVMFLAECLYKGLIYLADHLANNFFRIGP